MIYTSARDHDRARTLVTEAVAAGAYLGDADLRGAYLSDDIAITTARDGG